MEISPMRIFWMLVAALCFGAACGVLNDINRLVRVLLGVRYRKQQMSGLYKIKLPIAGKSLEEKKDGKIKKGMLSLVIFFQDVFLLVFFCGGVTVINYCFNDGRSRIYTPIVAILGFVLYYFTVGRIVIYFSETIAFFVRAVLSIILAIFYRPLRFFVKILVKIIKKMNENVNKALAKRRKRVYNNSKERNVIKKAAQGFVDFR